MRLFFVILAVVVLLVLITFVFTNPEQRVDVNVWGKPYSDVELFKVVLVSFSVGALFIAVMALIEGSGIRWRNRQLRRRVAKLETENDFLQEQARAARPQDLDSDAPAPAREPVQEPAQKEDQRLPATEAAREAPTGLASAPVYSPRSNSEPGEGES